MLKCTKFDFGWGSAPDPAREVHSAPQISSWILGGPTSKEKEGTEGERRGKKREG